MTLTSKLLHFAWRTCALQTSLACLLILGCQTSYPHATEMVTSVVPSLAAQKIPTNTSAIATNTPATLPRYPFPQHQAYAPGTIRPNQRTQAQQDADVVAFYEHWKASYLIEAGTNGDGRALFRVSMGSTDPGRTTSEGMGYGMLIIALMAGYETQAQTYFDGLWLFTRLHPSDIDPRLMGWQVPVGSDGNDSAFDGDADMAFGLLLADAQWGSNGRINYRAEFNELISAIYQSTIGPQSHLPMLGDWVGSGDNTYNQYTPRSSDFMPAHFRAWGRASGDLVWQQVISSCQAVIESLQTNYGPATGLLPDFVIPVSKSNLLPRPAPPDFLEGPHDGDYYYNALRDPWRIASDALLNNDPISMAQVRRISTWAESAVGSDPTQIRAGYHLNGQAVSGSDYFSTAFVAPLGPAAMTQPTQQAWLNAIYEAVRTTYQDYYEDSLTLFSLLVMTGNYWDPTTMPTGSSRTYLPIVTNSAP
jgi:endo-1,4-beta-D-glucanase Y